MQENGRGSKQPHPYAFTDHAEQRIAQREIEMEWIDRTLRNPDLIESHPTDPDLTCAYAKIHERDGRVLRVIYNETTRPWRIVTAYFDRSMRNRL